MRAKDGSNFIRDSPFVFECGALRFLVGFDGHFNTALHVEVVLGEIVALPVENHFEAFDRVGSGHVFAGCASEDFGHVEGL